MVTVRRGVAFRRKYECFFSNGFGAEISLKRKNHLKCHRSLINPCVFNNGNFQQLSMHCVNHDDGDGSVDDNDDDDDDGDGDDDDGDDDDDCDNDDDDDDEDGDHNDGNDDDGACCL